MVIDLAGELGLDSDLFRFKTDKARHDPKYNYFVLRELSHLINSYVAHFDVQNPSELDQMQKRALKGIIKATYASADIHFNETRKHVHELRPEEVDYYIGHPIRTARLVLESFTLRGEGSHDSLEDKLTQSLKDPRYQLGYGSTTAISPLPPLTHDNPERITDITKKTGIILPRQEAVEIANQVYTVYGLSKRTLDFLRPQLIQLTHNIDTPYLEYLALPHPKILDDAGLFAVGMVRITKPQDRNNNTDMKKYDPYWQRLKNSLKNLGTLNAHKEWDRAYREIAGWVNNFSPKYGSPNSLPVWYVPATRAFTSLGTKTVNECERIAHESVKTLDDIAYELRQTIERENGDMRKLTPLEREIAYHTPEILGAITKVVDNYERAVPTFNQAQVASSTKRQQKTIENLIENQTSPDNPAWFDIFKGTLKSYVATLDIPSEELALQFPDPKGNRDIILTAVQAYAHAKLIGKLAGRVSNINDTFIVTEFNYPMPETVPW
ncbi:MAG: hypothetical protein AABX51_04850 [Nanoarchaeota archaeon]